MENYTDFIKSHSGCFFWHCDAGMVDGERCLDVLVYDSQDDLDNDEDNSLAIDRKTVIDDRS